jgi:general secretion pathway protein A
MYAPFFGLTQEPFSIAPDPRFLFMSERHREALAHLLYGLSAGGGFVLLTGEIGAGKTTVCRGFLEQVPASCAVAYIFNPKLTVPELLRTVCDEFGVALPTAADGGELTIKAQVDALNAFLLEGHAQGRQAVLVIDEAQSLSAEVLEQLRLLTNLETSERKLLQIILIGQPELRDMLARPELEQLAQRVIARYHLDALSAEETPLYIRHRLAVAGPNAALPFDPGALAALHRISGGVPRRINLLADRALLGAYGQGQPLATREVVEQAAQEVFGSSGRAAGSTAAQQAGPAWWRPRMVWALAALVAAGLLLLLLLLWWLGAGATGRAASSPAASAATAAGTTARVAAADGVPGGAGTAMTPAPSDAAGASGKGAQGAAPGGPGPAARPVLPAGTSTDVQALLRSASSTATPVWRELALRWNVAVGEGDPCQLVPQAGLACFNSSSGGLPLVRQLARPGLLALRSPQGGTVHALLVALDDERATLLAGGQRYSLTLPELAGVWRGEFSTLWRSPPGWPGRRDKLDDAAIRGWIAQRLPDTVAGAAVPAAAELRERLRVLQVAQGLPSDAAGLPVTLMQLNRRSGASEPTLPANPER